MLTAHSSARKGRCCASSGAASGQLRRALASGVPRRDRRLYLVFFAVGASQASAPRSRGRAPPAASLNPDNLAGAATLARLLSAANGAASGWLNALPVAPTAVLSDGDVESALQLRLGELRLPEAAIGQRCFCKQRSQRSSADHALTCLSLSGCIAQRHDILGGIWCRVIRRAGIASSLEQVLRNVQRARQLAAGRQDAVRHQRWHAK